MTTEIKAKDLKEMSIHQKLLEVRKRIPYLKKGDVGSQYAYTGSSTVLGAVRGDLDFFGLFLVPKIINHNVLYTTVENTDKYDKLKKTTTYFTEIEMEFTWHDCYTKEELICPWYAQGVDVAGEKGVGKALTYAEKTFILKTFNIATDKDDPDAFQDKIESITSKPEEPTEMTKEDYKKILANAKKAKITEGELTMFVKWLADELKCGTRDLQIVENLLSPSHFETKIDEYNAKTGALDGDG